MIAEGFGNVTTSPQTRENIIEWTRIATNSMPIQMIKNAWRHGEYSWFLPVPAAEGPPAVVNAEEAVPVILEKIELHEEESEDDEGNVNSTDTE